MLFKANAPQAVSQLSDLNDPTVLRKRASLSMPAPQVSDTELEDIVKANVGDMGPPDSSMRAASATQTLIGNYNTALNDQKPTPLRTPMQDNTILQEARNLRILRDTNPLLNHQSDVEIPEIQGGFGFDGVDPRISKMATPNTVFGTPLSGKNEEAIDIYDKSARSSNSVTKFGSNTPSVCRDQLGLNNSDMLSEIASVTSSSVADSHVTYSSRIRDAELRAMISAQLNSLPEPEYTYDIAIPEVQNEAEVDIIGGNSDKPEDAAEVMLQLERQHAEERRLELARRSSVIKRNLPRPTECSVQFLKLQDLNNANNCVGSEYADASAAVNQEMIRLLAHDAYEHLNTASSSSKVKRVDIPVIEAEVMEKAKHLIDKEMLEIERSSSFCGARPLDSFNVVWGDVHRSITCVPISEKKRKLAEGVSEGRCNAVDSSILSKHELVEAYKHQFDVIGKKFDKFKIRGDKLETKLQIIQQGYAARSSSLKERALKVIADYEKASFDIECFESMKANEDRAIQRRLKRAFGELKKAESVEEELQLKFQAFEDRCRARFRV